MQNEEGLDAGPDNEENLSDSFVFECSWEVCNKVGGIYTVISSKAPHMVKKYGSNYITIGPYFADKASAEFVPKKAPDEIARAIDALKKQGIKCSFGIWEVKGKPQCILIDFSEKYSERDAIKTELWNNYRVDSLFATQDYDEPVIWSYAAGKLVEAISQNSDKNVILHCHEWLAGTALLYTKKYEPRIRTVFTTHATVLGRTISAAWSNLYEVLGKINPDQTARELNVAAKHLTEKSAALNSDVFTTVSAVTGIEAEKILGRKPDVILPNGLDFENFPDSEQIPIKHREYRARIREFLISYFFPYYTFDLEHSLHLYISGRYEYSNKGIDVLISALGKLNEELKSERENKRTIVVFFLIPAAIQAIRYELLESKALFEDVADDVAEYTKRISSKLLLGFGEHKAPNEIELFEEDFIFKMKKALLSFKKQGLPPLSTHHIQNEDNDTILNAFRANGLLNREEDRVKVVFYPGYLSSSDGLLNLDYYPAVEGCHLGIFPSSYEPWGYTPLESAGYGVPAITTDLAGFGAYMLKKNIPQEGIWVIGRRNKSYSQVVSELKKVIKDYSQLPHDARLETKHKATHLSRLFDWKWLVREYYKAHSMALSANDESGQ